MPRRPPFRQISRKQFATASNTAFRVAITIIPRHEAGNNGSTQGRTELLPLTHRVISLRWSLSGHSGHWSSPHQSSPIARYQRDTAVESVESRPSAGLGDVVGRMRGQIEMKRACPYETAKLPQPLQSCPARCGRLETVHVMS
jgi:uncharacterized membrane protein YccC